MDHTAGLAIANEIKSALTTTIRGIIQAKQSDNDISRGEGIMLALRGFGTISQVIALIQSCSAEDGKSVLYVWEHGRYVLPDEPEA